MASQGYHHKLPAQERQALMRLLRTQAAVRVHLGTIVDGRLAEGSSQAETSARESTPPLPSADSARLQTAVAGLCRSFCDAQKAQELLGKLR